MSELAGWSNFYVIVGSAAGALIGLQFVVMTLIANRSPSHEAGAAFGTPTIVHFCADLLLAALVCAPWQSITLPAVLLGFMGICGVVYAVTVTRRMRLQTAYRPEFEDWLFHALLPLASYGLLTLSALATLAGAYGALFGVGAVAMVLLFIGIHNSWDAVTYHVFVTRRETNVEQHQQQRPDKTEETTEKETEQNKV